MACMTISYSTRRVELCRRRWRRAVDDTSSPLIFVTVASQDWMRGSEEQDVDVSTVSTPATKLGLAAVRYLLLLPPEEVTPAIVVVPEMTISAVGSGAVVGLADGLSVAGLVVGLWEGVVVGGAVAGLADGLSVAGLVVGLREGVAVGGAVAGLADGLSVAGLFVGLREGLAVGAFVVGLSAGL